MIRSYLLRCAWICVFFTPAAFADNYSDAIEKFRKATEAQGFFENAYGYAVFPTVGKGGFFVGGAHGKGRVYVGGVVTGDTSLSQVSIGFQLGGEAFSEIIFFENKAAYDEFASGKLRFSAQAQAVAIVAGAQAQTGGTGTSSGAGVPGSSVQFKGVYNNGMAVFVQIKGGLMYEASVGGQKFSFKSR
jgi:lipid-binding SYLF domain-containing protein